MRNINTKENIIIKTTIKIKKSYEKTYNTKLFSIL